MLTQEELKELLHYNPKTGVFTWRVKPSVNVKIGDITGYKDKSTGYLRIKVKYRLYRAHKLAWLYMTGDWPKEQIDHINCIRDDNRWENLREATPQQNQLNSFGWKSSSSTYKGVSWHKKSKKWQVSSDFNGKRKYLGLFDCEHEAALVYNQYIVKHHGEYVKLNSVYDKFDVVVGKDD